MVVNVFGLSHVVSEPVVPLLINVLDEQRVEGVNVSNKQLPIFLDLRFQLKETFSSYTLKSYKVDQ